MATDPTAQAKLMEQMKALLEGQAAVYKTINAELSKQIGLTQQLFASIDDGSKKAEKNAKKTTTSQEELNKAIDDQIKKQEKLKEKNKITVDSFDDLIKKFGQTAKGAAILSAGMSTLGNATTFIKSTFSAFGGILESTFSVGMGLVNAFIGTIDGLFAVGAEVYNIGLDIQRAWEDVRETFGNLATNEGAAVKDAFDGLREGSGGVLDGGMGLRVMFGDIQSQIAAVSNFAQGLGASFTVLKDTFVDTAKQTLMMEKGLMLSAEAFKELGRNSMASGSDMSEVLDEVMVTTMSMSQQFGVSAKLIGKNFNEMAKDIGNFGDLSEKELVATAAYAAKLGLEMATLTSVMDKFDTFDSAADSAGKLAEVMGMNVDVMKMMNAESPAERIDEMRRAFQDTGKSVADLSRHELKMLQESMGFADAGELKQALSIPVDELGYDEMAEAAEEAADKMTPEEAMAGMTDEIKKLVDQMQKMTGGPFSEFLKGIKDGIANSPQFIALFKDLGGALAGFYRMGRQVGLMFGEFFSTEKGPLSGFMAALKDVLGATKDMTKLTDDLKVNFENFFNTFKQNPSKAITDLFTNMRQSILDFFSSKSDSLKILKDGIVTGLTNAFKAIGELAPKIIADASKYLQMGVDALKDFLAGKGGSGTGLSGAFVDALYSIKDAFVKDMLPVLGELFMVLMKKAAPYLAGILGVGLTLIFAKGIAMGFASYFATGLLEKIAAPYLKKAAEFLGFAFKDATGDKETGGTQAEIKDKIEGLTEQTEVTKSFSTKVNELMDELKSINYKDVFKAAANLVVIGTILVAALGVFGVAASAFMAVAGSAIIALGIEKIITGLVGTTVMAAAAFGAFKLLDKASVGFSGKVMMNVAKGLVVAVVGLTAIAAFAGAAYLLSGPILAVGDMSDKLLEGLATVGTFLAASLILMLAAAITGSFFMEPATATLIAITMAVGLGVLLAGATALAGFTAMLIPIGQSIIDSVNKLSDPDTLERGLRIIDMVIGSFKPIIDVGMTAMEISAAMSGGIVNFFMGGSDSFVDAMGSITTFFDTLIPLLVGDDGILGKIKEFIVGTADFTPAQIKKAEVITGIIGALGSIIGGIAPVLQTFAEMSQGVATFSTTAVANMKKLAGPEGPIENILTSVSDFMPSLIPKMEAAMKAITMDPKKLEQGAKSMQQLTGAFGSLIDLYGKIADFGSEMSEGVFVEKIDYIDPALRFLALGDTKGFGSGGAIVDLPGSLKSFSENLTEIETYVSGLKEVNMDPLTASIESMMRFMGIVGEFGMLMGSAGGYMPVFLGGDTQAEVYAEGAQSLMSFLGSANSPANVAKALATEVTDIATALASMGVLDLEELNLQALADPILSYDGEKEFTVNPGNIAVKIKMNVVMNAGEVAQSISIAADGDSYFQLTEKGTAAIADMEDV